MRMTLWYEKIGFSPNSINPFITKIASSYNILTSDKNTFLYYPLNLFNLKDDVGWIANDIRTSLDFNFLPGEILQYPETVKNLKHPRTYIVLYVSDDYKVFTRTYSKLQDLLATIGGFMKLVFSILNTFNVFIRIYLIDYYLLNKIFDNVSLSSNNPGSSNTMCISPPMTNKRRPMTSATRNSNVVNLSVKTDRDPYRSSQIKLRSIDRSDKSIYNY
jgi:hypothetical protein